MRNKNGGIKMNDAAKQWDKEHPKEVPKDRPCDWCGEPVEVGYIHPECFDKERKLYLEIGND